MLKNFDSPDVYMLAGFYFCHANDWYTGAFCIMFAIIDAYVLNKQDDNKQ
jgi:hypothetical protein